MRFSHEASKVFVGQELVLRQLAVMAEEVLVGGNVNILLEAPSGYGKTYLAHLFFEFVDKGYKNTIQYYHSKGEINFATDRRFQLIDEVHLLTPPESIYSELSSGLYTFILATNRFEQVAEAILTRCSVLRFSQYTDEEIALMVQLRLEKKDVILSYTLCKEVAHYCRGIPRVAKNYTDRLSFIFRTYGLPTTREELHEVLYEYLGKKKGGYTEFDTLYLQSLEHSGGQASLETLVGLTSLPRKVIVEDIEPFLLRKRRIIKTMRGRKLIS